MVRLSEVALRSQATRALALALLLAGAGNACTTNHDALALRPKAGTGGGGAGGSSSGFGGFGNTGDRASDGGRSNPDDEPQGDNVLTIVNGVIDAPSVRLCFARVGRDGQTSDLVGSPLPALDYASSTVLTALDDLSLADDVIQPWVIAGELSLIKKLNCEDAVALAQSEEAKVTPVTPTDGAGGQGAGGAGTGGAGADDTNEAGAGAQPALALPTLRARPLAALPAGTVNIGRSILMVLTGCLGGAAYRDHIDTSACGADYTPASPTVQPLVVKLSRDLRFDKVGLQALHASLPTGPVDVRASGDAGAVSLVFASNVTFGAVLPRPANTSFTPVDLGVDQGNYGLQAVGAGNVLFQEAWPDILASSGIDSVVAARTYTAIFLGPDPLLIKVGWWNKSAFTLIDNDPTR